MKFFRQLFVLSAVIGLLGASADTAFAAEPATPKDMVLKGDAKCTGCHDEADDSTPTMLELHPSVLAIGKTPHGVRGDARTPTCTDCHGDSEKHIGHKGSGKPPKPDRWFTKNTDTPATEINGACLACHKGGERTHWEGSQHASQDVACTSCHQVHAQHDKVREKLTQPEVCFTCHKEQRADSHKMSHHPIIEGKVTCSDCHNPHGSSGPKLLKKNTVTETCFTCHAEKRGPFLFEHQPVTEDCTNCHNPHGSNVSPLLNSRPPFMCLECHDGPHTTGAIGPNAAGKQAGLTGSPSANNVGAGCMNCHRQIHGSNSPAGGYFQR